MPRTIVEQAIQIGFDYAAWAKKESYDILGTGEVGMANTTTATACILPDWTFGKAVCRYRCRPFAGWFDTEKKVIQNALIFLQPIPGDGLDILSKVGGAGYCRDGRPVSRSRLLPNPGGRRWLDLNCGGPARQFPSAACPTFLFASHRPLNQRISWRPMPWD